MTSTKLNGFTIAHLAWILLPLDRPKKKKKERKKKEKKEKVSFSLHFE